MHIAHSNSKLITNWFKQQDGIKIHGFRKHVIAHLLEDNNKIRHNVGDDKNYDDELYEITRRFPNRVPDFYKVIPSRRQILWGECDEWHPTSKNKITEIADFNDWLLSGDYVEQWGITLIIIKIKPIPAMIIYGHNDLGPCGLWECSKPLVKCLPDDLHNKLIKNI